MTKPEDDISFVHLDDRIDAQLLNARRVFICNPIDNDVANEAIKRLWYLELQAPKKPILLVINSPGGSVDAGFAIWDAIKMISSPVSTLVTGMAASMGSVLMLAAPQGKRFATPKSRIMIHQPSLSGTVHGQATDLEIQAREMLKTKKMIIEIYMEATKKSYDAIEKAIDRDTWMSAEEAKTFGLVDTIVTSYKNL